MRYADILNEVKYMQDELECILPSDINEAIERGKIISSYHARAGHLLAEAKRNYRQKRSSEIAEKIIEIAKQNFLSAKAQNAIVESIAEEDAYLVDCLERIGSTCTHQLDFLRSIISKEKEEMRISSGFNYGNKT